MTMRLPGKKFFRRFAYFFKLIRVVNLLFIVLIQYYIKYFIINPNINSVGEASTTCLSDLQFALLVLATVFLAAAGYIINDYFDIRIDRINKPGRILIGRIFSRRFVIAFHTIFNIIGIVLGFYVSIAVGFYKLGILFIIISLMLWFYSTTFKRQVLTGNLIIAFLSAFVLLIVWIFDFFALKSDFDVIRQMYVIFSNIIIPYFIFAFIISLIREIIKDIEDREGDSQCGAGTLPVVYGIRTSRYIAIALSVLLSILLLAFTYSKYSIGMNWKVLTWFLICTVLLPLLFVIYRLFNASEDKQYYSALSDLTRIIMFAGINSILILYIF